MLRALPRKGEDQVLFYPQALTARAAGRPKGERTRAQIQAAACAVLDRQGPQEFTVSAVCEQAGISNGTFYIYFADRTVLLDDLLVGFVGFLQAAMRVAGSAQPEDPVRAATSAYVELFRRNPGLMRCLVHHLDTLPQAREAFHRLNRDWLETVVAAVERRLHRLGRGEAVDREELLRRAYALGGMVDQYLSALILSQDPALVAISASDEAVIDTLTLIWKRGMSL
ncbi:TetR/AcrR family transcriptional regulator [Stappia sp. 28M-7]|uniref:TetR/AcrR family transcriptional regulator n=1 Tax=Stappia sp. 28M-7 TaxID=2762596 RepID=UPI00163B790E|nr:TetR/AcrR family transcriptional regulator [Stappia sp. 28M-7]MBC2860045.1 TetR/AcrR family transcriptional regulator [Stappia sp. 28M-7]